jgi:hypothetical protein
MEEYKEETDEKYKNRRGIESQIKHEERKNNKNREI